MSEEIAKQIWQLVQDFEQHLIDQCPEDMKQEVIMYLRSTN